VHDHRTDLLAVDRLRRGGAAAADQARDLFDLDIGIGSRWPHFGRTTTLNVANDCASVSGISPAQ
jgi:hypothetical protein